MNFKPLVILLLLFSLGACKKDPITKINNLNGDFIYVIGHGGTGFQSALNYFPENSFGGIKKAIEIYNADGVEVDVQITKDFELVLYHDDKLETSTNGNGFIYEYTLAELNQFKYDRDAYANILLNEKIVSLEKVLQYLVSRKIKAQLHLDLRPWLYNNAELSFDEFSEIYTSKIKTLIQQYNYENYTYIASGSSDILKKLNDTSAKLLYETSEIHQNMNLIKQNNWYGVVAYNENVTKSEVDFAHQNNVRVVLFNVIRQPEMVKAVNKHPDFIITDNLIQLQQVLYGN